MAENFSAADEILKLKKLLDDGIITQEEFDAKKESLLTGKVIQEKDSAKQESTQINTASPNPQMPIPQKKKRKDAYLRF